MMLPITVDAARVRIALIGNGQAACRRLSLLDRAGATRVDVYADAPEPDLAAAAGDRLRQRLPSGKELVRAQLVFLAGVGEPRASQLRQIAESAGVLLNVEDDITRSSFHSPAVVRRGDLTVAISTGGKSPGLAAALRRQIEASLGAEWDRRIERIATLRAGWRDAGHGGAAIARLTTIWLNRQGGFALMVREHEPKYKWSLASHRNHAPLHDL
jgi:precorrin-2 dehydrogenase / sirohydrochlorin ferrochelatase